jgi:hypothetical protein
VSGLGGGGQGIERKKDNFEPLHKTGKCNSFYLTVTNIIATGLPL